MVQYCHTDLGNSCGSQSIHKCILHHPVEMGTQVFDDEAKLCCETGELKSDWVAGYTKTGI